MIEGQKPKVIGPKDPEHGRRGKNDNYPGCTAEFVKKTRKRRAKNKAAKAARKKNRG